MKPGKLLGHKHYSGIIKRLHGIPEETYNLFNRLLQKPLGLKIHNRLHSKLYNGIALRGAPNGYRL